MGLIEPTSQGAKLLAKKILEEYINEGLDKYKITNGLSTIFIAGAPGAGKTEFLETVLDNEKFITIDIDKYRKTFSGYNGKNAENYQNCSSRVATAIFDFCIKNDLRLIFDGTLSSEMGIKNIEKSIKKNRSIGVVLIYQDPTISYTYTLVRELKDERKVSIDAFIRIYYESIKNCFYVKEKYPNIQLIIASKTKNRTWKQQFFPKKFRFDKIYKIDYNKEELGKKLIKIKETSIIKELIKRLGKKQEK